MTTNAELIAEQLIGALEARKIWGGIILNVKDLGAKGDGKTDDSEAIQRAINRADAGSIVFFPTPDDCYLINSTIQWNKKVFLQSGGIAKLKAGATIDAIIKCTGFTTYQDVSINGFFLDGNHKANHCLLFDGSTNGYITRTMIDNCECRNAVLDGIRFVPPAWVIGIRNTLSNDNGRDGLRAIVPVASGENQLNHIFLDDNCIFSDNGAAGINIMGTDHSIGKVDVEGNYDGIKIDMSQNTGNYVAWSINIAESYIENNKRAQIYLNAVAGDQIRLGVSQAYINSFQTDAGAGDSLIKCAGTGEGITLNMQDNYYSLSGTVTKIIDGGNTLGGRSLITEGVYLNESKFTNLGLARVMWDYLQTVPFPLTMNQGVGLTSLQETANILALSSKIVSFPLPIDPTFKLLHSVFVPVVSDCTAFTIRIYVFVTDLVTGANTSTTSFDVSSSGNNTIGGFIVNNLGYFRIPSGKMVSIRCDVLSYTGTTMTFKTPYMKLI